MYTYGAHALLTYSSDFEAARLDPCELRTVKPYTLHVKQTLGRDTCVASAHGSARVDIDLILSSHVSIDCNVNHGSDRYLVLGSSSGVVFDCEPDLGTAPNSNPDHALDSNFSPTLDSDLGSGFDFRFRSSSGLQLLFC
ncbi:hypothetical protein EVAR_66460_1 [Eumeta japonica]|uniref:Uncharacterized protein n=1 Tax=Eumeta variegata TaxID=151549 RepID=A0A4C1ZXE2_EUMVA|nr:hypothetical protein EVAR_66460_1 [Eumeta japonica]